jgi:putative oxidoreductase
MNMRALPPVWGITIVRVAAGIILFVSGLDKLTGGGFEGFTKTTTTLGIPLPQLWGVFIPLLELIGGTLLLVGLGARWVALLFVVEFIITTFALKAVRQPPFGGFTSLRIDLMMLAASVAVALVGPGALALESVFSRARRRSESTVSAERTLVT